MNCTCRKGKCKGENLPAPSKPVCCSEIGLECTELCKLKCTELCKLAWNVQNSVNAQVVNSSYTGRILPQKSNQHMTLFEDGGAVYYHHDHNDRLHTKELEFTFRQLSNM